MIKNGGFPYNVFSMLYNACVTSVADYSGTVTGYLQYDSSLKIHLRAIRAFLGVPKTVCNVGVLSEVDLLLTKQIFVWDRELNKRVIVSSWSSEIKVILTECNLDLLFNMNCPFELKYSRKVQIKSKILSFY